MRPAGRNCRIRFCQDKAAITHCAHASACRSSPIRVTIWMPSGSPSGPSAGGHRDAGHVQAGPDQVEHRIASPFQPGGRLARRRRRHQRIQPLHAGRELALRTFEHRMRLSHLRLAPRQPKLQPLAQPLADLLARVRQFPAQRPAALVVHDDRCAPRRSPPRLVTSSRSTTTGPCPRQRRWQPAAAVPGSPAAPCPRRATGRCRCAARARAATSGSPRSRPATAPANSAQSATLRAITPTVSRLSDISFMPNRLIVPNVGL